MRCTDARSVMVCGVACGQKLKLKFIQPEFPVTEVRTLTCPYPHPPNVLIHPLDNRKPSGAKRKARLHARGDGCTHTRAHTWH
eukprot:3886487-Pyramimonas_sp.AAC.1